MTEFWNRLVRGSFLPSKRAQDISIFGSIHRMQESQELTERLGSHFATSGCWPPAASCGPPAPWRTCRRQDPGETIEGSSLAPSAAAAARRLAMAIPSDKDGGRGAERAPPTSSRGQPRASAMKSRSRRLTSSACSCCTQWPAPSTRWQPVIRVQISFCMCSKSPGFW